MSGSVLLILVTSPSHRTLFNRYLGTTSHHLIFATDGEEAFDRFHEVKPDLVIAHVRAAKIDAAILCQLIRRQQGGERIPYVILSEEFTKAESGRARAAAIGADGFLAFPFDRGALMERIMTLLTFGRPQSEAFRADERTREPSPRPHTPSVRTEFSAVIDGIDTLEPRPPDAGEVPSWTHTTDDLLREPVAPSMDPVGRTLDAADTVVAYVAPFGKDFPAALQEAPVASFSSGAPVDASSPRTGDVDGPNEAVTHVELVEESDAPFTGAYEALVREERPIRIPLDTTLPQAIDLGRSPIGSIRDISSSHVLEEPSISGAKSLRADPLEEPPIAPIPDHSENSEKRRLIQELPRDQTPSHSDPAAVVRDGSGVRRGLDESQLGKRLAKRVRTMFRLLDEVDYYQVLGVDPDCSKEALKNAYFELSLEFHPDRFFLLRSGDLKEKIYAIYRRITEAHGVLSDERRRAAYDEVRRSRFEKGSATDVPGSFEEAQQTEMFNVPATHAKAKHFIDLARAAFTDGDALGTRLHLHLALTYEGDNTALRAALESVARLVPIRGGS